jgi:hypothetical protein
MAGNGFPQRIKDHHGALRAGLGAFAGKHEQFRIHLLRNAAAEVWSGSLIHRNGHCTP